MGGGENLVLDNIKRICEQRGISFYRIEHDCNMGNGVIARWAYQGPSVKKLKAVADYLGVSMDELLRDEEGGKK